MLKILDVPGAIGLRRYPPGLTTELPFRLEGDFLTENDGGYVIAVAAGRASCVRDDHGGDRILTPRGWPCCTPGCSPAPTCAPPGSCRGGDLEQDLDWDALFGGRQAHIRDYF